MIINHTTTICDICGAEATDKLVDSKDYQDYAQGFFPINLYEKIKHLNIFSLFRNHFIRELKFNASQPVQDEMNRDSKFFKKYSRHVCSDCFESVLEAVNDKVKELTAQNQHKGLRLRLRGE